MKKVFFSIMLCAFAFAATAQTNDSLRTVELEGVQVISTRANKDVPMAYSNFSKKDIQTVNHGKDVPQMLNMMPSVTSSSDAGMGVGYTGIHVRGTDPTRINITTNGIPMNDAESAQLYWVNLGDLASSLESVQLQRGVGTSTNGGAAFGATINMQTENIGMKPYFTLDLSGGSYGTHKETLKFSTGILNGHWGLQGRLSNIGSDGYIDRASSRLNSYFLQAAYFGEKTAIKLITFNGTEKTYMAWDYASKADMEKYGRTYNPSGKYTDLNGNTAFYDNQTDNYHQQNYQLLWNQTLNDDLNFNVALHYTHGNGYYEQYKTDQKLYKYLISGGLRADLVRQKKMLNDFYGAVASVNYDNHNGLKATLGGGLNKYDGDHFGVVKWVGSQYYWDDNGEQVFSSAGNTLEASHEYYRNNAKKTDGNIYAKLTYRFMRGLNGFIDLQYRHVGYKMDGTSQEFDDNKQQRPLTLDKTYNFFNPKFGLSYNITSPLRIYASYAIAHKEPTRNDFEDMLAETEEVNPEAERLNDLEIGAEYKTDKLLLGANFYYMDYDNQFVLTGAQDANGEMVARNIKDSYRMGIELMAQWRPIDGLDWGINATLSKNRARNMELTVIDRNTWALSKVNVGETPLAFSPAAIVNHQISYTWRGFRVAMMNKFVSKQYMTNSGFDSYIDEDNNNERVSAVIDAFSTTDIDLSYSFKTRWTKNITVGATIYNIFNRKYESNGSCGMNFATDNNGNVYAFQNTSEWFYSWSVYSAQAPIHFLAHASITF